MKNGGTVHLQKYQSMPHVFVIFEKHPSTETCYRSLATFTKAVTAGQNVETRLEIVNGKGIIQGPIDLEKYPIEVSKLQVARV